jgi:hypothetical protein
MESLVAFKRAGADGVLTYFAPRWRSGCATGPEARPARPPRGRGAHGAALAVLS